MGRRGLVGLFVRINLTAPRFKGSKLGLSSSFYACNNTELSLVPETNCESRGLSREDGASQIRRDCECGSSERPASEEE